MTPADRAYGEVVRVGGGVALEIRRPADHQP